MSILNRLAKTPPMGWNSYCAYSTAITESQFRANAEVLARRLRPFGYEYAVMDMGWYQPAPAKMSGVYGGPAVTMDKWGRFLPAVNRFPSAANGKGLRPLADFVHSLGLKFGIHIMRGIPREAVRRNLPLHGQHLRARAVADTRSACSWCTLMWGVDMTKNAGWKYYEDLVKMYADWGVDFIKADDMASPYWEQEIEAVYGAMQKRGRGMVLSLSPGDGNLMLEEHARRHCEMLRVCRDFWDRPADLREIFGPAHDWVRTIGRGHWPDLDMLPLGRLRLHGHGAGPGNNFTRGEQRMVMSLWTIHRSPLMIGGDLLSLDAWTANTLTNPEVLEVTRSSSNNRELFRLGDAVVWSADRPRSRQRWISVFNTGQKRLKVEVPLKLLGLSGSIRVRDLWSRKDLGVRKGTFSCVVPRHDAQMYRIG
jgi:alpha-galactosidase